jgi:hypothetical protein
MWDLHPLAPSQKFAYYWLRSLAKCTKFLKLRLVVSGIGGCDWPLKLALLLRRFCKVSLSFLC